jgi:hypothetical protein
MPSLISRTRLRQGRRERAAALRPPEAVLDEAGSSKNNSIMRSTANYDHGDETKWHGARLSPHAHVSH